MAIEALRGNKAKVSDVIAMGIQEGDGAQMTGEELEKEENWDFDRAEQKPGRRARRAVVSVAFNRDDFELVTEYAEQTGRKLSGLLREAILNQIDAERKPLTTERLDVTEGLWSAQPDGNLVTA